MLLCKNKSHLKARAQGKKRWYDATCIISTPDEIFVCFHHHGIVSICGPGQSFIPDLFHCTEHDSNAMIRIDVPWQCPYDFIPLLWYKKWENNTTTSLQNGGDCDLSKDFSKKIQGEIKYISPLDLLTIMEISFLPTFPLIQQAEEDTNFHVLQYKKMVPADLTTIDRYHSFLALLAPCTCDAEFLQTGLTVTPF